MIRVDEKSPRMFPNSTTNTHFYYACGDWNIKLYEADRHFRVKYSMVSNRYLIQVPRRLDRGFGNSVLVSKVCFPFVKNVVTAYNNKHSNNKVLNEDVWNNDNKLENVFKHYNFTVQPEETT